MDDADEGVDAAEEELVDDSAVGGTYMRMEEENALPEDEYESIICGMKKKPSLLFCRRIYWDVEAREL